MIGRVGRLGCGIIGFLFFGVCFVGMFAGIMFMLKGDAYNLSLQAVSEHRTVIADYGTPIEPGYFVTGSINTSGGGGEASLQYKISGPERSGQVFVEAVRFAGQWELEQVVVVDDSSGKRITVVE